MFLIQNSSSRETLPTMGLRSTLPAGLAGGSLNCGANSTSLPPAAFVTLLASQFAFPSWLLFAEQATNWLTVIMLESA